jgi:hypothetical protein
VFVEQHPHDRHRNKHSLHSAQVKSHVAKSYRFPKMENPRPPAGSGVFVNSLSGSHSHAAAWQGEVVFHSARRTPKAKSRVRARQTAVMLPLPTPRLPPSLFPDASTALQSERSMVFEYYVKEWWPHSRQLGVSSAIYGFTPILSLDHQLVNHMVASALHYPNSLSMEAILAASSCRMQIVRNQPFKDPHLCEVFYLQALQSLRARLNQDVPADEQLVLDLCKLMYAEIFNKSGPPADVLWNLCKESIVKIGGLKSLSPTTALSALSTDFFVSNAKLTTPVLDVYRCPELLGLQGNRGTPTALEDLVRSLVAQLDPRCRAIIELTHQLGAEFASLWKLPSIHRSLVSLRTHRTRFAKNFRSPLSPLSSCPDSGAPVPPQVLEADCEALQMKMWAFNTWLAYCSITDESRPARNIAAAPVWAEDALSTIWRRIDAINLLLIGTDWELRQDHLLWVCTIGVFASTDLLDRSAYCRILAMASGRLGITSVARLREELSLQLPLDQIPNYDEVLLCPAFDPYRERRTR